MGDPIGSGSSGGKKNSHFRRVVDHGSRIVDSTIGRFGRRRGGRDSIGRIGGAIASSGGGPIASGSGEGQDVDLKRKGELVKSESMEGMKLVTKKSFEAMERRWKAAARADSQIRDPDLTEETGTPPSENSD
jgi:hypothetical protein